MLNSKEALSHPAVTRARAADKELVHRRLIKAIKTERQQALAIVEEALKLDCDPVNEKAIKKFAKYVTSHIRASEINLGGELG